MLNVAESRSIQAYDLAKNIYQEIYDPLNEQIENQRHAITGLTYEGARTMQIAQEHDTQVKAAKAEYFRIKAEMDLAVQAYENLNYEGDDEESNNFYKSKLFREMNTKMRVCQEKANVYDSSVNRANEGLKIYSERMQSYVRVFNQLSYERNQLMIDSLNKLVIFETSVEMNLKYDTKMFSKMIEKIQTTHDKVHGSTEVPSGQNEATGQACDAVKVTDYFLGC